ncbi:hypothetical protein [Desulfovibrio ferrophilus]|uniref:Uncharacterized protein n=1 Tax=Desulfovibrio ferrophilus TaxID=241368 RepID=A0A2Z6B069_9BACT|nr:hypothetical protein [Desulfovibrio ferrophilus]BBD08853.1 uncharacterized protein DFE_2127 [Desulfovibrio ferrophilus]
MILTAVLACVVLLIFALVFGGIVRNVRTNYLRVIRSLRHQSFDLENGIKDLKADMLIREVRVSNLEKEIESLELAKERERAAAAAGDVPSRTIVEALQYMGKITAEDVLRARTYLENTKSGSTVEEALMILGLVRPEDMDSAAQEAM